MLVFSIRIFPIAAAVCLFGVLPLNYYGQYRHHLKIPSESLDFFTIGNVQQGSRCLEGLISHSGRKRSACSKVLYFTVWNVFFVNVFSGSIISQLNTLSSPKEIPTQLAKAVPSQATIFITYVLTSGWASLSSEVIQLLALIWNFTRRCVFRRKGDPSFVPSVPYQTEVPRVLLFWLLGFTCAILSPLILPFLLVYLLGYVVYRNQILNVYAPKYETGGQMWPIAHNTTIFSLLLAQIIARAGCFWDKEITSCLWLRHPASHTPVQRVLQTAVSSYFQEFFFTDCSDENHTLLDSSTS